jgi:hypothetical protein
LRPRLEAEAINDSGRRLQEIPVIAIVAITPAILQ